MADVVHRALVFSMKLGFQDLIGFIESFFFFFLIDFDRKWGFASGCLC
jgi:hypothetical protein